MDHSTTIQISNREILVAKDIQPYAWILERNVIQTTLLVKILSDEKRRNGEIIEVSCRTAELLDGWCWLTYSACFGYQSKLIDLFEHTYQSVNESTNQPIKQASNQHDSRAGDGYSSPNNLELLSWEDYYQFDDLESIEISHFFSRSNFLTATQIISDNKCDIQRDKLSYETFPFNLNHKVIICNQLLCDLSRFCYSPFPVYSMINELDSDKTEVLSFENFRVI
jgi:hypothetical protein